MESRPLDTELRCRMNLVKCERFKTFQPEPPNKKFPFYDEFSSIHRLRVMNDQNDLDKGTDTGEPYESPKVESVPVIEEEIIEETPEVEEEGEGEESPEVVRPITGVLRDDLRRIDVVLVVNDDVAARADRCKLDFVTNVLRTGLEVEVEPGVMDVHKHLSFILIHAPDSVLYEYGNAFAVNRCFVDSRLDLMASMSTNGILEKIRNFFRFRYFKGLEMEWLKIIRGNYTTRDGFSHNERSLIVYKILRHLPYGDHVNQYGLHRLLKRNVILDAYALHDGPYFRVPQQTTASANGRQVLYYYWTGLQNLFQSQPLHIIHEYFGPKIAFYYAFYEFYNAMLTLPAIAGVFSILMRYIDRYEPDTISEQICKGGRENDMCPECNSLVRLNRSLYPPVYVRCYKRPLEDYCTPMAINGHLDHPYVPYFAVFMMLWALTFVTAWRWKEYVLNWLWEVGARDSYYKTSTRPEFEIDYLNPRKSSRTGLKYDEKAFHKVLRVSLPALHSVLCVVAFLAIADECKLRYDDFSNSFIVTEKKPKTWDYTTLAAFQILYTLVITVLERLFRFLHYNLVDLENHRWHEEYEKAFARKQIELSLTLMYPFMCYYAWCLGRQLVFRGRCQWINMFPLRVLTINLNKWVRTPWQSALSTRADDCRRYCWPFTCINELGVLLAVMLVLKQVVFRLVFHVTGTVTDYNEDRAVNTKVPCWEREYKLKEFNEATLTRKYMTLAVQFSLVTFFSIAFPFASLLVLVVNVWELRHSARELVLATRRPLLIRSPGIGAWSHVFLFLAYAAIVTNTLTLVATTKIALRQHFQSTNKNISTIVDFSLYDLMTYYDFSEFREPPILKCANPILRRSVAETTSPHFRFVYFGSLPGSGPKFLFPPDPTRQNTTIPDYFILITIELTLMFFYAISMILCGLLLQFGVFRPYRSDIDRTTEIEYKIKNLYSYYSTFEKKNIK